MPSSAFQRRLAELQALRSISDPAAAREPLRKALADHNNFLVGRAAEVIGELRLDDLIPDLLVAYDRFFVDPVTIDPKCLAKSAIAQTLRDLGHHGAPAYLRGITHVQMEPAWGGRADTAAPLRATCALGLSDSILDDLEVLTYLTDSLADPEKLVRINAAIAIEQLGRAEGALLLRLKMHSGDPEPDVLGQCFSSLLNLAPESSVTFIARFLRSPDQDVQLEAASAIAQARDPRAIEILREFWRATRLSDERRQALVINLGASPQRKAADFLLALIGGESVGIASTTITALAHSRFRTEIAQRLAQEVKVRDESKLLALFDELFA